MKREKVRDTGLNNLNSAAYRQVLLKYLVGTGRAKQSESMGSLVKPSVLR